MKCFTIKASRELVTVPNLYHPMAFIVPELYPHATEGIIAHRLQAEIEIVPGVKLSLSPELLKSCSRVAGDPDAILIQRASVERRANGALWLVPEKSEDAQSALVWLDLGRGAYSSVRYELGNCVHLRVRRNSDELFGSEELALVDLAVGRPFHAYRSSRKWLCFGGDVVGERLLITYDGCSLKCEAEK